MQFDLTRTSTDWMRLAQESLARGQRTQAMDHLARILMEDPDHASAQELLTIIQEVEADRSALGPIAQLTLTVFITLAVLLLPSGWLLYNGLSLTQALITGVPTSIGLGILTMIGITGLRHSYTSATTVRSRRGCMLIGVPASLLLLVIAVVGAVWVLLERLS